MSKRQDERRIRSARPRPHADHPAFAELVVAARDGAGWAYTALYRQHAGAVLGFLRARGTPEPEEVVNDVFVAAFLGLVRFEGDEPGFRAWLYQIARHKRVDALRRVARMPDTTALDRPGGGADPRGDAEAEAIARLEDDDLQAVLEPLTGDQRDVLLLRIIADLSLDQTATVLDKPVGAIKALQRRALIQLRRRFPDNPYPSDRS